MFYVTTSQRTHPSQVRECFLSALNTPRQLTQELCRVAMQYFICLTVDFSYGYLGF